MGVADAPAAAAVAAASSARVHSRSEVPVAAATWGSVAPSPCQAANARPVAVLLFFCAVRPAGRNWARERQEHLRRRRRERRRGASELGKLGEGREPGAIRELGEDSTLNERITVRFARMVATCRNLLCRAGAEGRVVAPAGAGLSEARPPGCAMAGASVAGCASVPEASVSGRGLLFCVAPPPCCTAASSSSRSVLSSLAAN